MASAVDGHRRLLFETCTGAQSISISRSDELAALRNAADILHQTTILDQVRAVTIRRNFRRQRQRQKQNEKGEKTADTQSVMRMTVFVLSFGMVVIVRRILLLGKSRRRMR